VEIVTPNLYSGWDEYFYHYCRNSGIIEACPAQNINGIIGSPAISFLIEPDGVSKYLCCYDKINSNYFRNVAAISPQQSIENLVKSFS